MTDNKLYVDDHAALVNKMLTLPVYMEGDCIRLKVAHTKAGYPNVGGYKRDGSRASAYLHRVACRAAHGPAPSGKPFTCHRCDNPGCVNPRHLYWGSPTDNINDTIGKRKSDVLTLGEVRDIKERHAAGERRADLAAEYGVSMGTVRFALRAETFCRAGGPWSPVVYEDSKSAWAQAIRDRYIMGDCTQAQVADEFGTSTIVVRDVVLGRSHTEGHFDVIAYRAQRLANKAALEDRSIDPGVQAQHEERRIQRWEARQAEYQRIRDRYIVGDLTQAEVAAELGVRVGLVTLAVRHRAPGENHDPKAYRRQRAKNREALRVAGLLPR